MKHLITAGLVASLALVSLGASAQEAFTAGKPQVGAALNYGIYTGDDLGGDLNPYGLGFGVRGGYTLDMNLHLGASFDYFLGGSEGSASVNIWNFMLEPGYDLAVGEGLVIRPQLGIGLSSLAVEVCVDLGAIGGGEQCADDSESKLAIAPGAQFLVDLDSLFFQAGLRYHHVFVDNGNADGLLLNAGAGMAF